MNERQAIQAIINRLVGDPRVPLTPYADLPQPWRTIYLRVKRAESYEDAEFQIWKATEELEGGLALADALCDLLPDAEAFSAFPSLLDMQRIATYPPTDWLWPSWIPLGHVTILGAAPGAGKSLLALDLARRLIAGLPFPDGAAPFSACSRVLFVDAENTPALLNQRAQAWDIDRHRLFLMLPPQPNQLIDLIRPDQQELLSQMCFNIQPDLLIVDSLAAVSSRSETSLEAARELLGFLASFAARYQLALFVIHHLRKRRRTGRRASPPPAADDLRGSGHISAVARTILTLSLANTGSATPDPNGPRRFEVVKTNLCTYPPPLYLQFESGPHGVPTLHYSELQPAVPPTKGERCERWLLDYLQAHGPTYPRDVVAAAAAEGFPRATLYRVRRALGPAIADQSQGPANSQKRWTLAESPPPAQNVTPGTP